MKQDFFLDLGKSLKVYGKALKSNFPMQWFLFGVIWVLFGLGLIIGLILCYPLP